ncbi:hypothetical protein [Nocardiopsis sp. CNR-923]|uniref:hypothetical protein n=1 Tax=Nocardiopsis sp. CNR-923 TaxID=1904965 RepID=UPI0021CCF3E1|nr:hypothetical protein [Nocardiopsis sp. CNR-923]
MQARDVALAARFSARQASGRAILELWAPAEQLPEVNARIVGPIEPVRSFLPD